MASRSFVYSALGRVLEVFEADRRDGTLSPVQSLAMPALIQYVWFNAARTRAYVATSDAGPMAKPRRPDHFVQAFDVFAGGALRQRGAAVRLGNRPLYVTLDVEERHLLLAYNDPPDVTVHRLAPDGAVGAQVRQQPLEFGPTVHQVRLTPTGTLALVPACAHDPQGIRAGSVGIFSYRDGRLAPLGRLTADPSRAAPWQGVRHGAQGFAARHVTFHPTRAWMYLCVETQGELWLYDYHADGIAPRPRAIRSTLAGRPAGRSSQMTGAVHVHPNGRFVYVSNRAWDREEIDGQRVFVGGVNDIAVFAIDEDSGEPTLIQHADTHGFFPRTFGIDAEGELLVVGNEEACLVREGGTIRKVLPSLAVFRIGDDGCLTLLTRHDHPDNGEICFWVGVISLPANQETKR